MGNTVWSSPFSDADAEEFYARMRRRYNAGVVMEPATQKWSFMLGTDATDYGNASGPLIIDVIGRAGDVATAAGPVDGSDADNTGTPGVITTRPREPALGPSGTLPVGTSMLLGGIGVVVFMPLIVAEAAVADPSTPAGTYSAIAAADDALAGVQAAFDASIITISDARNRRGTVTGHEAVSYGTSRVAVYGPSLDAEAPPGEILYAGQVTSKDRGWARLQPVYLDGGSAGVSASQMAITMYVPRSTAWPIRPNTRFRVDVMVPTLLAYQGSAGNIVCDPVTGQPVVMPPGMQLPPAGQRIQPPARW